MHNLASEFS